MPELPEVEVVRAGLAPAVTGARVVAAEVRDHRALKRHLPLGDDGRPCDDGAGGHSVTLTAEAGRRRAADFERRVTGLVLDAPVRRGKFMWIPVVPGTAAGGVPSSRGALLFGAVSPSGAVPLHDAHATAAPHSFALLAHLGMSGQMLLREHEVADDRFVRIRLWIAHPEHGELRLDFADQRLFGSLALDELVPTADGAPGGWAGLELLRGAGHESARPAAAAIPSQATHIARDPLDAAFDDALFAAVLRSRSTSVKQLLLDQGLVSGIGNIYADETLWRARVHPETPGRAVGPRKARELLTHARAVFAQALAEGGTSFDEQYVNVNGEAGYFAHSLNAYGKAGEPCPRCGTPMKRIVQAGRGSHFCQQCQRRR